MHEDAYACKLPLLFFSRASVKPASHTANPDPIPPGHWPSRSPDGRLPRPDRGQNLKKKKNPARSLHLAAAWPGQSQNSATFVKASASCRRCPWRKKGCPNMTHAASWAVHSAPSKCSPVQDVHAMPIVNRTDMLCLVVPSVVCAVFACAIVCFVRSRSSVLACMRVFVFARARACVCMRVHACTCVCIRVRVRECVRVRAHECASVQVCAVHARALCGHMGAWGCVEGAGVGAWMCVCLCVCVRVRTRAWGPVCVCVCVCAYLYMYMYIYIHTSASTSTATSTLT